MIINKHSVLLLLAFLTINVFAQHSNTMKGYRIDGEDIVFIFNPKRYSTVSHHYSGQQKELKDLKIKYVVVSGEFNNWTRNDWVMHKIENGNYELRKKLSSIVNKFDWEFKFLINKTYWVEPHEDMPNITPAYNRKGKPLYVYNLKVYTAYPDIKGNAPFRLKGFTDASKVILTGSFNKWDEKLFEMNPTNEGWELTLQLNPDIYEYKFIVDGNWIHDPNNPSKVKSEFQGYNSVVDIKVPVKFMLNGYLDAKEVILAGSFNDWNEEAIKMKKQSTGWESTIFLSGGKHHYKYIVDKVWIVDPLNPVKEYDGRGNINSVCMVKD